MVQATRKSETGEPLFHSHCSHPLKFLLMLWTIVIRCNDQELPTFDIMPNGCFCEYVNRGFIA